MHEKSRVNCAISGKTGQRLPLLNYRYNISFAGYEVEFPFTIAPGRGVRAIDRSLRDIEQTAADRPADGEEPDR